MKIRVEVEVEPTELREFLGLPDVTGLQQEALDALSHKLRGGAEGLDPMAILRGFVPSGLLSVEEWQRLLRRALAAGSASTEKKVSKKPRRKKKTRG
ncbi:MAG: DUF6489 family protein [Gammaproteobacteria bacterium]|jgi:hypothetical protein